MTQKAKPKAKKAGKTRKKKKLTHTKVKPTSAGWKNGWVTS